jgi:hypothetical protein
MEKVFKKKATRVIGSSIIQTPILNDCYLKEIHIKNYEYIGGHWTYTLTAFGRTRFLYNERRDSIEPCSFDKYLRFRHLEKMHKQLKQELQIVLEKKGKSMPVFPGKKSLFTCKAKMAETRSKKLEIYFSELFTKFGKQVRYSQTLIDLFSPEKLNIHLLGSFPEVQETYMETLMEALNLFRPKSCKNGSLHSQSKTEEDLRTLHMPERSLNGRVKTEDNYESYEYCSRQMENEPSFKTRKHHAKICYREYNPFDYIFKRRVYRIELINKSFKEEELTQAAFSICKQPTPAVLLMLTFHYSDPNSFAQIKHVLSSFKLFIKDGMALTPFVLLGFHDPALSIQLSQQEVSAFFKSLFGQESLFYFLTLSNSTKENIVNSLHSLLKTHVRLQQQSLHTKQKKK